jgi:uncharacterized protein (TIGR03792 family)
MVIEELRFMVPPEMQELFVSTDREIWTQALSAQPGFLGKEIWRNADQPDDLRIVIRWASRQSWKAVPRDVLDTTERRFAEALGRVFPVLQCTDLDVLDGH